MKMAPQLSSENAIQSHSITMSKSITLRLEQVSQRTRGVPIGRARHFHINLGVTCHNNTLTLLIPTLFTRHERGVLDSTLGGDTIQEPSLKSSHLTEGGMTICYYKGSGHCYSCVTVWSSLYCAHAPFFFNEM